MTSGLKISALIRCTASAVNSWKGSETAKGETPVPLGSFKSLIVYDFNGALKSICFLGSNSSVGRESVAIWVIGSIAGRVWSTVMTSMVAILQEKVGMGRLVELIRRRTAANEIDIANRRR